MSASYTLEEWHAEAKRRFGNNSDEWKFVCPVCKHITRVADWKSAGASEGEIAFSCVGRRSENKRKAFEEDGKGPCNYAGGGLFKLNPITVSDPEGRVHHMFDFAEVTP